MDSSDDAFHTFLGLDRVIYLAVNGTIKLLQVWNDMRVSELFILGWSNSLTPYFHIEAVAVAIPSAGYIDTSVGGNK